MYKGHILDDFKDNKNYNTEKAIVQKKEFIDQQENNIKSNPVKYIQENIWLNQKIKKQLLLENKQFKQNYQISENQLNNSLKEYIQDYKSAHLNQEQTFYNNSKNNNKNSTNNLFESSETKYIISSTINPNDPGMIDSNQQKRRSSKGQLSNIFSEDKGIIGMICRKSVDCQNPQDIENAMDDNIPINIFTNANEPQMIDEFHDEDEYIISNDADVNNIILDFKDQNKIDINQLQGRLGNRYHKQFECFKLLFNENVNLNNYLIKQITKDHKIKRCSPENIISELRSMIENKIIFIPTFFQLAKMQESSQQFRFCVKRNKINKYYTLCKINELFDLKLIKKYLIVWFNTQLNNKENEQFLPKDQLMRIRKQVCQIQNMSFANIIF